MKRLLFVMGLALIAAMALLAAFGTVTPARADGTIPWGGQGSTTCPSGCHWVVQCKDCGSVTLYINGTAYPMTQSGNGSWSVDSTGAFDPNGAVVSASYTGAPSNGQTGLELSHANDCTSNCGGTTEPPPTTETTTETVTVTATTETPCVGDQCTTETTTVTSTVDPCIDHPEQCTTETTTVTATTPAPTTETVTETVVVTTPPPTNNICDEKGHKNDPDCESDYHRRYIPHTGGGEFAGTIAAILLMLGIPLAFLGKRLWMSFHQ